MHDSGSNKPASPSDSRPRTLAVDIGGTSVKAAILDAEGERTTRRRKANTPRPATPEAVLEAIHGLALALGDFERVSVGFPGVIRKGCVYTAVNLDGDWYAFDLRKQMSKLFERPVRVVNDAELQGFSAIRGRGVELVLTLGTGMGSGLFRDGRVVPNLELAHHPFEKGRTYEEILGKAALEKAGAKEWNARLRRAIAIILHVFNPDTLFLGGGLARRIDFELPAGVERVDNKRAVLGGIALWRDSDPDLSQAP